MTLRACVRLPHECDRRPGQRLRDGSGDAVAVSVAGATDTVVDGALGRTASDATCTTAPILALQNVESAYGPIRAIRGVSLQVQPGRIATVLGSNGAGKSTILKTISGIIDPRKGTVEFKGRAITALDPALIVRRGISHVPEGREVFPLLSVRDNLMMGAYTRTDRDAVTRDLEAVYRYFPILRERAGQDAGLLSGGQQQMLAIARALMAAPELMLLDEPSLGLSPLLRARSSRSWSASIASAASTILLVEQNAHMALNVADFGYVLENGRIVMEDYLRAAAREGRHQGVLPRHESRRARRAALEEEEDLEMTQARGEHEQPLGPPLQPRDDVVVGETMPRCSGTRAERETRSACGRRISASGARGPGRVGRGGARESAWGCWRSASRRRLRIDPVRTPSSNGCYADFAVLCCGGVSNGIYPTDAAPQVQYLCADSRTRGPVRRGRRAARQGARGAGTAAAAAQDRRVRHGRACATSTTRR